MPSSRFSMRLDNQTRYDPRALKSLLMEAVRRFKEDGGELRTFKGEGPEIKTLEVTCVPAKQDRYCGGRAWFNSGSMKLHLPYGTILGPGGGDEFAPHPEAAVHIVDTFYHELHHCMGFTHAEMPGRTTGHFLHLAEWAKGRTLPFEEQEGKKDDGPLAKQRRRYKHAKEKMEEAEGRVRHYEGQVKRNKTIRDKWSDKVAYYERTYPELVEEDGGDESN